MPRTTLPSASTTSKLEAVTSDHSRPKGNTRKRFIVPGIAAVKWLLIPAQGVVRPCVVVAVAVWVRRLEPTFAETLAIALSVDGRQVYTYFPLLCSIWRCSERLNGGATCGAECARRWRARLRRGLHKTHTQGVLAKLTRL